MRQSATLTRRYTDSAHCLHTEPERVHRAMICPASERSVVRAARVSLALLLLLALRATATRALCACLPTSLLISSSRATLRHLQLTPGRHHLEARPVRCSSQLFVSAFFFLCCSHVCLSTGPLGAPVKKE